METSKLQSVLYEMGFSSRTICHDLFISDIDCETRDQPYVAKVDTKEMYVVDTDFSFFKKMPPERKEDCYLF